MKADLELVQQVLREREDIDPQTAEEVVKQLMVALKNAKEEEAMELVPARCTKEVGLWVKTKEPVLVITTDNQLPIAGEGDVIVRQPGAGPQPELPGAETFFQNVESVVVQAVARTGGGVVQTGDGRRLVVSAAETQSGDEVEWDDDLPLDPPEASAQAAAASAGDGVGVPEREAPPLPPEAIQFCRRERVGDPQAELPGWVEDKWREACREYAVGDDLPRRRLDRFRHLVAQDLERRAG